MDTTRRDFLKQLSSGAAAAGVLPVLGTGGVPPAGARPPWPPNPDAADDEAFWRQVRAQYPLTEDRTYLNTGGLGPAPYPVLDTAHRITLELQAISEHGHHLIVEAREPVASFFGVKPSEIAFTRNATEANSTVASGLRDLRQGDEVIFESHAHPGGSIPWMNRQKAQGIRVKIFEPDPESAVGNLERIEALITPRTRVIQISHVTAPTGIHLPAKEIAELARSRGIWFHIDGAQSAGMFPVDLRDIGCDSYGTSGHKWMGAPHGTGVLYVREDRLDQVIPTEVGAYSDDGYELPDEFTYHPTAQRYEPGTRDAASVQGIAAAVHFLEEIGMPRIASYGQGLARYLQDGLRAIDGVTVLTPSDPDLSGSITTYKTARVPYDQLFQFLMEKHKLRCRVVSERGLDALRVSAHIFNTREDCDRVIEGTIDAIANA